MTIGQRIKKARLRRGLTQQELGVLVGFPKTSADVRIAQYEASARKPKAEIKEKLSNVLKINPRYLYMPENYDMRDIVFLLFELGEEMGCVQSDYEEINKFLIEWTHKNSLLTDNTITQQEYMDWLLSLS
jgi:transcriptional regulator with XRE-family HTH domain